MLTATVISPNETLSVAHGGSFPGVVTWGESNLCGTLCSGSKVSLFPVDNLYLARDVLEAHLWGWAQVCDASASGMNL